MTGQKILLVDDEEILLEVLQDFLEQAGFEVVTARSGEEAFSKFEAALPEFDLIFTDVRMADGDGVYLLTEIRKISSEVPVILHTGFSDYAVEDLLEMGATRVLHKPVKMTALVQEVKKVI